MFFFFWKSPSWRRGVVFGHQKIAKDQGGGLWTRPFSWNPKFINFSTPPTPKPLQTHFFPSILPPPFQTPPFSFCLLPILKKIDFSSFIFREISYHLPKDRQRPGGSLWTRRDFGWGNNITRIQMRLQKSTSSVPRKTLLAPCCRTEIRRVQTILLCAGASSVAPCPLRWQG